MSAECQVTAVLVTVQCYCKQS